MQAAITIAVLVIILAVAWRFLGDYLAAVYGGRVRWLAPVERLALRALGVDPTAEQDWKTYAVSLLAFSLVAIFFTYAIQRLQGFLPLNPQHLPGVTPALAFNTAVSFVTNTNWQNYAGETTMSYFTQMAALAVQMFASAAVGMAVAIARVRGLAARKRETIGNFWVDVVRGTLYVLLPIAAVAAVVFVAQGAVQTLAGPAHITDALNGVRQTIPRGPVASQEAIKQLGTNGGGFFNANGAHPFENPTPVTNLLSVVLILIIPVALTRTFGKMVGSMRQGVAILAVMTVIFAGTLAFTAVSESRGNAAVRHAGITAQASGNLVGKETRFGTFDSALYDVTSTQTSTGSVDSAADSYTPLGGLGMLSGMMLGEVSPGGVGSGLYTILLFAVLAVFIGGLMVGRTPEYLGKKIQAKEVQLATIGILVMPITVL
ncbi:MAG: potassium-transporting ATPase subunit KdpA, partial [Actinomycetota bacterium]|nr:potassium-transporting ATPase subunit KdpA [Actinomycetota bacterium]